MRLAELPPPEARRRLRGDGLSLAIGPFTARLQSAEPALVASLLALYADYTVQPEAAFADFRVRLAPPSVPRRFFRPQVQFYQDGFPPFRPLPRAQAFAFFEWALNWSVASTALHYLVVHAAVVERDGWAVLLPGAPGAGKSTLCAALALRGWRLLSDEMALLRPGSRQVVPIPRPVGLKNESIAVIRRFAPEARVGPSVHDTAKGTVAHLRPPRDSVLRAGEPATVRRVIFPLYVAGARLQLTPRDPADAMLALARNAMTYDALGELGFDTLCGLVDGADCHDLRYSELEQAVSAFDRLALDTAPAA